MAGVQSPGCLPGSTPKDPHALLTVDTDVEKHATALGVDHSPGRLESSSPTGSVSRNKHSTLTVVWAVLTTLIAFTALVLGAWATAEVKNTSQSTTALGATLGGAILVPSAKQVPSGYNLVMNIFRGTGYWSQRAPIMYFRSDFTASSYRNVVYLVGGQGNDGAGEAVLLNNTVAYDPLANTTTELAAMPAPMYRHVAAVVGNRLYVFGGVGVINDFNMATGMQIYDFSTQGWSATPSTMNVPRTDSCGAAIDGKIYAAGGYGASDDEGRTIEVYDPVADTWMLLPAKLKIGRGDCVAVASGGKLYVMGGTEFVPPPGVDCSQQYWLCYQFSRMVEVFDPAMGTVTRMADMREPRGDFGAVESSPGKIVVAGGEYSSSDIGVSRLLAQPWVEEYDVAEDYWTPKAPLPEPRFRFAMTQAADQVLAFGGSPACANVLNPTDETRCHQFGLRSVYAYDDVPYTPAYLAVRA